MMEIFVVLIVIGFFHQILNLIFYLAFIIYVINA